ncbi:recombination-associated protein RdgC [Simiduia aestuariiviva]|uniref:Recombination-associated protein RdgC n=1 Tax=Simiduia aestuariiviva TaxID=1510459 RepID=A0A839UJ70_9GAMM|nr:recombination-associated protein RdgC [Simiduia aestuariiviva]MBB3168144.1 recombination associated protein RdgC [Simiduia aestuariiviva]
MWFKNLQIYRISDGHSLDLSSLSDTLKANAFAPCSQQDMFKQGWVPPLGKHSTEFTHIAQNAALITLRKEEKVLPAAVIRDMVEEKAGQIEAAEERRVYRKEKEQMKEEILFECLPRALRKSRRTHALIDLEQRLIIVDAASPTRAEELITALRQSLGSLPLALQQYELSPAVQMTQWVSGNELPDGWQLENECELRETGEEGAVLKCKRHDLLCEEIQSHIDAGKQVFQLALNWQQQLTFVLTHEGHIKRLSFGDELKQEAQDSGSDQLTLLDSEFTLMTLSLRRFLPDLAEALGGNKAEAV